MIRLGRVVGLPIALEGCMVGRVEQTVLTGDGRRLRGLVVRHGLGIARWVAVGQIALLGRVAVVLKSRPGKLPQGANFTLSSVKDSAGLNLGRVMDAYLNPATLQVEALEISLGLVEELTLGRFLVRDYVVQSLPGEVGQVLVPCGCVLERMNEGK